MSLPPSHFSALRLPRGEVLSYLTSRPNIRVLTQQIRRHGYQVWDLHIDSPCSQRQQFPQADWLHAIVLGRVILLIAELVGSLSSRYSSSDSVSDQRSEISIGVYDSDNVDPDLPEAGY